MMKIALLDQKYSGQELGTIAKKPGFIGQNQKNLLFKQVQSRITTEEAIQWRPSTQ